MRAQGSLEYLIIIGVVISITAVITLLTVTYFGGQQEQYYYTSCQQAAATCDVSLSVNPSNPCTVCDTACNLTDGTEIFDGAVDCCRLGMSEWIYEGSEGCPDCGDGVTEGNEECDDGNLDNTDSCTDRCRNARCGDGYVWLGNEECDDGNLINTDSCVNGPGTECVNAECGDGYVWLGVEECDDGNDDFTDDCTRVCTIFEPCEEECDQCEACTYGRCTARLFDMYDFDISCYHDLFTDLGEQCTPCTRVSTPYCSAYPCL